MHTFDELPTLVKRRANTGMSLDASGQPWRSLPPADNPSVRSPLKLPIPASRHDPLRLRKHKGQSQRHFLRRRMAMHHRLQMEPCRPSPHRCRCNNLRTRNPPTPEITLSPLPPTAARSPASPQRRVLRRVSRRGSPNIKGRVACRSKVRRVPQMHDCLPARHG